MSTPKCTFEEVSSAAKAKGLPVEQRGKRAVVLLPSGEIEKFGCFRDGLLWLSHYAPPMAVAVAENSQAAKINELLKHPIVVLISDTGDMQHFESRAFADKFISAVCREARTAKRQTTVRVFELTDFINIK